MGLNQSIFGDLEAVEGSVENSGSESLSFQNSFFLMLFILKTAISVKRLSQVIQGNIFQFLPSGRETVNENRDLWFGS